MIRFLAFAALCAVYAPPSLPGAGDSPAGVAPSVPSLPPPPRSYGLLWLDIAPAGAMISLDGLYLDTNVWLVSISPGSHRLSVRKQGFLPMESPIGIVAGKSLRLEVRLVRDSAAGVGAAVE